MAESYTLQRVTPFPFKISISHRRTWIHFNRWFPGLTWVHIPNEISISSAIFAQLTTVTDWQTDRPHHSNSRAHLHSTVMQPNNINSQRWQLWNRNIKICSTQTEGTFQSVQCWCNALSQWQVVLCSCFYSRHPHKTWRVTWHRCCIIW